MLSGYIAETKKAFHEFLTNKMTIKLNVFRALMENRIFGNIDGCLVVTVDWNRSDGGESKFK